jgi:hypothetical protein
MQQRFKQLCERLGYKIVPIATKINGILSRRPDIVGVDYHGEFVMVVPKRMYGFPNKSHRDLVGMQHPDYFTCEKTLYLKTYGKI